MGTWHCLVIFYKEKLALAHQGSYDGSPGYVGRRIVDFLRNSEDVENVKRGLSYLRMATKEEEKARSRFKRRHWDSQLSSDLYETVDQKSLKDSFDERGPFPTVEADHASDILPLLAQAGAARNPAEIDTIPVTNDVEVMYDGEYGYVLDLDKGEFEVYCGLIESDAIFDDRFENHKPATRFRWMSPCCIKSYKLSSLPTADAFEVCLHRIIHDESDKSSNEELDEGVVEQG